MQSALGIQFGFTPYHLSGVVYTTLLNHRPQLAALGEAMNDAPYKAPPRWPVLGLKPRNTLAADGDEVVVPNGFDGLLVGATLGLVIGRTACRVPAARAREYLAGYIIANDLGISPPNHYRPAVRLLARDGFCPLGPQVVAAAKVGNPDDLAVEVLIDGELQQTTTSGERVRDTRQLLADVTEFMTLQPGDILLLGTTAGAPRVRAGQTVEIRVDKLGSLTNHFVSNPEAV